MTRTGRVVGFEVLRAIKKKSFWYSTILIPVIFIVIGLISYASSHSASATTQSQTYSQGSTVGVLDQTGLLNKQTLEKQHITIEPSTQVGIAAVKDNRLAAFFYYPKNVAEEGIQVYSQDQGISFTSPYNDAAVALLRQSAVAHVTLLTHDTSIVQILEENPPVTATTYKNGQVTKGIARIVAPGIIWIVFLALIVLLSYYTLAATTEEKENRAAEMLLTSIKARSLIVGKILSIFVLALAQIIIIVIPLLIAYAFFKSHISLPGGVSLSQIPISASVLTIGFLFLLFGLALFIGLLVGFGSLFPSAQEASRYLFLVIVWTLIPIWSMSFIVDSPNAPIVTVFTYFPLTAPSTVLLRNAVGNISTGNAMLSFAILIVAVIVAISFAIRAFRYGAMEYGRRISIREIFK